eukprot:1319933-Prymnesium_polylepis.1
MAHAGAHLPHPLRDALAKEAQWKAGDGESEGGGVGGSRRSRVEVAWHRTIRARYTIVGRRWASRAVDSLGRSTTREGGCWRLIALGQSVASGLGWQCG